jgi:opacity protein-like surface antigen
MNAALGLLCSLLMASGQDEDQPSEPTSWFDLVPTAWAAGMKGTVGVKGLSTEVGSKLSDVVEHVDPGALLTARIRLGDIVFGAEAHWVRLTADGETPGSDVESEDLMAGLTVGYRLPMGARGQAELFAGARARKVDTQIDVSGVTVKDDDLWVDPILGGRFDYYLGKYWSINALIDVGGFDVSSRMTSQVLLGVSWHLSSHFRVALAIRYLADDFVDGGFRWQITEHGVILGVGLRF